MLFQKSPRPPQKRVDRFELKAFGAAVSGEGWGLPVAIMGVIVVLIAFTMGAMKIAENGINVTVRVVQEPPPTPVKPPPAYRPATSVLGRSKSYVERSSSRHGAE